MAERRDGIRQSAEQEHARFGGRSEVWLGGVVWNADR